MKRIPVAARTLCFLLWLLASSFHNSLQAQSFSIVPSQMEISVAPTFDHAPVHVAVTSTVQGFSVANLQLSSDSTWVKASADATNGQLILSFSTSSLTNSSYTATITAKSGTDSVSFFVKASVTPLNIIRLKGDPKRSRTYGIQQNGLLTGSVVILDPVTATHLGNITVGKKPCDIAESPDGLELLVINSVDQSISVIDLINLLVKETIKLPAYDNWGAADTAANVGFGPNGIVYYTDGAWTPNLRVFDRKTGKILQTTLIDGQYGFGNFALTGDFTSMFGWGQFGWTAGIVNSFIVRLAVASSGTVTFQEKTDSYYNNAFQRDPLNTPVLISSDNKTVFVKGLAVDASSVKNVKYQFPGPVYSITPGGEIAVTDKAIYETKTGNRIADLPVTAPVQTVSSDYSRLIYYDTSSRTLKTLNLLEIVGPNIINRQISPADGSITLSPAALSWPALPGIYRYRIYLDQSQTDVSNADPSSPAFLGDNFSNISVGGASCPWRNVLLENRRHH